MASASSSLDDLPNYLSIIQTTNEDEMDQLIDKGRELIKDSKPGPKSKPTWVKGILTVDDCYCYIQLLVKNYIMDSSVIVYDQVILPSVSDINGLFMGRFINAVKTVMVNNQTLGIKKIDRIYALMNAQSQSESSQPVSSQTLSHQNWICLKFNGDSVHLTRFEPSDDYEDQFKIGPTCIEIMKKLLPPNTRKNVIIQNITTDERSFGLNRINGCRLFSTILTSLHVLDIDISNLSSLINWKSLKNANKKNLYSQQNCFGCVVNDQIKIYLDEHSGQCTPMPRLTRSRSHSFRSNRKSVRKNRKTPKRKSVRKNRKTPKRKSVRKI